MGQEEIFREELAALLQIGKEQGGRLSKEQVKNAFPDSGIDKRKISHVYEYLIANQIAIDGVSNSKGQEKALDEKKSDTQKEKDFGKQTRLPASLPKDIEEARAQLLKALLPKVSEIARLYEGQGVLQEDLIGEGNVALFEAMSVTELLDAYDPKEAEGFFAGVIMEAMEDLIDMENKAQEADEKVLERINRVADKAEELYKDLRRKITVEELCAETDLTEEEIREACRLSGDQIDIIALDE
ncbi:MAG: hypothetical protein J1E61_09780 [Lachnospiraceae bacterium]|nr:hypothetical protein [Lachnospiraceae bacterium]